MHLKKEEFREMMFFLEKSYGHSRGFFPRTAPHVWRKETIDYENRIIAKEEGKIVSHVGIFPLTMVVKDAEIKMGGIGGVATLPEFRGKGYMSKLMNFSIQKMRKDGYPLSILWGDRQRYGYFGYEVTGREIIFTLSRRSLKRSLRLPSVNIMRLEEKEDLLEKIILIHNKEPIHIKRKREDYTLIFTKPGLITYLAEKEGDFAYLSFYGEQFSSALGECGGNPEILFSLIYHLLERWERESLEIPFPYFPSNLFFHLLKVCSHWYFRPLGMVKILNLRETIRSYFPFLKKRTQGLEFKGTLTLEIEENKERITLNFNSGLTVKEDGEEGEKVSLPEREMVKFLFESPYMVKMNKSFPLIYLLFPLPLYVAPLDRI